MQRMPSSPRFSLLEMMMMMILVRCFTTHTKIAACFSFLLQTEVCKAVNKNTAVVGWCCHQNKAPNSGYSCGVGVGGGAPMPGYPAWYRGYSRQAVTAYPLPGCAGVCQCVCWCATDPTCVVRLSDCCQSHCHSVCSPVCPTVCLSIAMRRRRR